MNQYYKHEDREESPFICSDINNGMLKCSDVPHYKEGDMECNLSASLGYTLSGPDTRFGCVNWNQYYNVCRAGDRNPHDGAVNFDNIGYAWIAIFQVSVYWSLHSSIGAIFFGITVSSEDIKCLFLLVK